MSSILLIQQNCCMKSGTGAGKEIKDDSIFILINDSLKI